MKPCSVLTEPPSQNFDPQVKEKASIYVPAIGKVTIVMLLRNLVVWTMRATSRVVGIHADSSAAACSEQKFNTAAREWVFTGRCHSAGSILTNDLNCIL
jgi:hypothetical protein